MSTKKEVQEILLEEYEYILGKLKILDTLIQVTTMSASARQVINENITWLIQDVQHNYDVWKK